MKLDVISSLVALTLVLATACAPANERRTRRSDDIHAVAGPDGCSDVPPEGACDGDVLTWCQGRVQEVNCAAAGMWCGLDPGTLEYGCL